jgi:putative spermidine/putrescine transport system permease protein
MLAFVAAFAVFPSAVMVGNPSGETRVISIAAYQAAYERFDYPMASTIAMVMAGVELAVIGVILGLRSRLYRGATAGGKG